MKKGKLISVAAVVMTAALFLSNTVLASVATVYQSGPQNQAQVQQAVYQVENSVTVQVKQYQNANYLSSYQTGNDNVIGGGFDNMQDDFYANTGVDQVPNALQDMVGEESDYAVQDGIGNMAILYQNGEGNEIAMWQVGDHNFGTIAQYGDSNTAGLLQYGDSNIASITQIDYGNTAMISQDGNHNTGIIYQSGGGNEAYLSQIGNGHTALISQTGGYNSAVVTQSGPATVPIAIFQTGGDSNR